MILTLAVIHLELPEVHSLKGRRSVLGSMKEKLGNFNVSVLDISGEYTRKADLAFAFLSHDSRLAAQYREKIEHMLERNFSQYWYEIEYEEL